EQIVIDAILGWGGQEVPHVIIAVVNAAQLNRNLYLVLQLLELRVPVVVALNMMDDAAGQSPTAEQLQEMLGVPCVATNGQTGGGTQQLLDAAIEVARAQKVQLPRLLAHYSKELLSHVDRVAAALPASVPQTVEHKRALALWALMSLEHGDELQHIPEELRLVVSQVRSDYLTTTGPSGEPTDLDLEIVQARYHAIDERLKNYFIGDAHVVTVADRVDRFVLHPFSGGVTFLVAMLVVFQAMFAWADPAISLIEDLVTWLQDSASSLLPPSLLTDLFVQGVLGGVGNVIVFLPQILLLFLLIGLLEDSGYMARVAYLMDRTMKTMGLHGRAFVPLLSGFACAIPAIMATRTLENRRDRLLTMLVVPLMTCSARLPIYSLIIAALFPVQEGSWLPTQGLLLIGMYAFSVVMSLFSAWVLSRTVVRAARMPLILELPPYRLPRLGPTLTMMQARAWSFLRE
ncbi:MAG TPA: ferrous iron transport protein B, partial [Polyangiaceae bacterium]|nr:ferrous iron transport protein B [Polyangiaceae bacterium]